MELESKDYSWAWVTADRLLSHGACEFWYATLTAGAGNADVTFYDGENTSGDIILILETLQNVSQQLHFTKPIYCRRGLYVDIGSNVSGVLVVWRELGHKEGG